MPRVYCATGSSVIQVVVVISTWCSRGGDEGHDGGEASGQLELPSVVMRRHALSRFQCVGGGGLRIADDREILFSWQTPSFPSGKAPPTVKYMYPLRLLQPRLN